MAAALGTASIGNRKLKRSGNDADHPITLDDVQPTAPAVTRHMAAASSRKGSSLSKGGGSGGVCQQPPFHLVYPPNGVDQIVITNADVELLKPGQFLNDSIIDFGLKHIWLNLPPQTRDRFYFFNTFFFTRWCLAEDGSSSGGKRAAAAAARSSSSSSAGYAAVSKWTKKVDIFSKDFLVVPINDSLHWSLAIICYPAQFFQPPPPTAAAASGTSRRSHTAASVAAAAAAASSTPSLPPPPPSSSSAHAAAALRSSAARRHRLSSVSHPSGSVSSLAPASLLSTPPSWLRAASDKVTDKFFALIGRGAKTPAAAVAKVAVEADIPDPFEQQEDEDEQQEDEEEQAQPPHKKPKRNKHAPDQESKERTMDVGPMNEATPITASSPSTAAASASSSSIAADPTHVPAILYLDSLLPPPDRLYEHLSRYLREEWAAKAAAGVGVPAAHPDRVWTQPPHIGGVPGAAPSSSTLKKLQQQQQQACMPTARSTVHYCSDPPLYVMRVPEQMNGCDCGLYLLEYTERFTKECEKKLKKFFAPQLQQQSQQPSSSTSTPAAAAAAAASNNIHTLSSVAGRLQSTPSSLPSSKLEDLFMASWSSNFPHSNVRQRTRRHRQTRSGATALHCSPSPPLPSPLLCSWPCDVRPQMNKKRTRMRELLQQLWMAEQKNNTAAPVRS